MADPNDTSKDTPSDGSSDQPASTGTKASTSAKSASRTKTASAKKSTTTAGRKPASATKSPAAKKKAPTRAKPAARKKPAAQKPASAAPTASAVDGLATASKGNRNQSGRAGQGGPTDGPKEAYGDQQGSKKSNEQGYGHGDDLSSDQSNLGDLGIRALFMLFYGIAAAWFVLPSALILSLLNLIVRVIDGKPQPLLSRLIRGLGVFLSEILDYLSLRSTERPFPFDSDFPMPKE